MIDDRVKGPFPEKVKELHDWVKERTNASKE
jgi:hypothetical protein